MAASSALQALAAAVLDHHLEIPAGADAAHRRRRDDEEGWPPGSALKAALSLRRDGLGQTASAPRSAQGLRPVKTVPEWVAFDCVATEKPAKATTCSTPGVFRAISVARLMTAFVRSSDEPFGSSTMRDQVALVLLRG